MSKLTPTPSILALGLVTVFGLGSAVAQAAASDTHTVNFTGLIYESGCQIDNDNQTVDLGAASASFLKTPTNRTSEKNFNIKITGCKLLSDSTRYEAGAIPLELVQLTFEDTKARATGPRDNKALTAVQATDQSVQATDQSAQVGIHVKINTTELTFDNGRTKAKLSDVGVDAGTGTTVPFTAWFQGIDGQDPVAGNFKGQMTIGFEYL